MPANIVGIAFLSCLQIQAVKQQDIALHETNFHEIYPC